MNKEKQMKNIQIVHAQIRDITFCIFVCLTGKLIILSSDLLNENTGVHAHGRTHEHSSFVEGKNTHSTEMV